MGNADRCRFENAGTTDRCVFQLDRADPLAARFDHVLGAIGQAHRIVGMDDRDVASVEPVVGIDAIFVILEITADDRCPARLEMA